MRHPSVAHAVAFAMPHKRRGEEVGASVVLRPGQTAGEHELHDFVAARLPDLKVPREIIFVYEIPKGATGKLERAGLAQRLGFEA
jgi:oxalate---CoA ligase